MGISKTKLKKILTHFPGKKILVIGDVMVDEYIWGKVNRISPEAPVPVVEVTSESYMPGGATNVVNNLHSLGATVFVAGVIGDDAMGRRLSSCLKDKGIHIEGLIVDEQRPTTVKTRIIAHNQQVVRVDREKKNRISDLIIDQIREYTRRQVNGIDALIISDYGKGVINPRLLEEVISLAKRADKLIAVDPKVNHFFLYKGVTVITPNHYEAGQAWGITINGEESLTKVGRGILSRLECEAVLITRGEQGMSLFERNGSITHIPTVAKEVYDVTGAGDTVISAFTLALAAGASLVEAAHLSNCAAGIVVGKVGTATVTRKEIEGAL